MSTDLYCVDIVELMQYSLDLDSDGQCPINGLTCTALLQLHTFTPSRIFYSLYGKNNNIIHNIIIILICFESMSHTYTKKKVT